MSAATAEVAANSFAKLVYSPTIAATLDATILLFWTT
jgi:hypothetical protein